MHLTLELTPEEGSQLREQASQSGREMGQYVKDLIVHNLRPKPAAGRSRESMLLEIINQSFPVEFWKRFRALDRKRKRTTISAEELQELVAKTEQLEMANIERVKALIELSRHWQVDLDVLLKKLGPLNGKSF
jgi:hypothetical protein